jgi:tetratricopeptide (TPR) repeat protein
LIAHQVGKNDTAVDLITRALAINPDYADAHANLGLALQDLGKPDEAVTSYNKAIAINPDHADAYSNLGTTLQALGKFDEAVTSYNKAIAINPDFSEAYNNMANALKELGNIDEAVASYNKALAINPDLADAHNNLGVALKDLGKLDEALASYNKALAINPDYAEAHSNLGLALQDLGQLDEAVASYNKAISIKPDYAEAHNNLGNALQDLGKPDEAVVNYNRALTFKPDYAEVHCNLGIFLFERRQYEKAVEHFKLTDFGKSKSYILKCLYEQDEQSLFYDQLDDLISQGEINSIIGSLSSRSEIRYRTSRPNPFCKDPLNYVLKTDLTEQCDFKNTFVNTTKNILNSGMVPLKNQGLLTNGHQTAGNLLLSETDFMSEIKEILETEVEKYRVYFKDSEEGFIKNWPTDYNLYCWLISMKSGGELKPHMHEEGWISGSVYINVPPKIETDSGNLVVCIDDKEDVTGVEANSKMSIDVITGSLCLFPASLLHYTIPFESEEERIVLAFDINPK